MPEQNVHKNLVTRFIREVWSEGNIDATDKYIASTYTIHHDPGDPWDKQQLDLAGYKERVRLSRAPFPDQKFELHQLIAEDDAVVVTWFWTAAHRGDLPGFPATGRRITMSGATVYSFADRRITGHWQIADRLGVYQQLRKTAGETHG
jgi:steroid delta-isomerase-like uncharacterized protein